MKKVQLFLASLPLALSVACGTTNELVFEDDFEGTGLPDSLRWNYEEGYVRNGELQYYTVARPENCYRQDGYLHIVVRRDSAVIENGLFAKQRETRPAARRLPRLPRPALPPRVLPNGNIAG